MAKAQVAQVSVPEDIIALGIGQPEVGNLPLEKVAEAAAHCFGRSERDILQYGMEQGNGSFRISLAGFLGERYGTPVDPGNLFITAGVSQALDLICTLLTRPGDTIFVEEPSYFLALRIFEDHGLNVVGIPVDGQGMRMDALEEKLAEHRPVFLYTIPVFHNPSGATLPAPRREVLVGLSEQHDFLIVADEVYQLLAYTAAPPPPLATFDRSGRVLSLGSFSKILAPGLRLGWIQAKPEVLETFRGCGYLVSGGGLNPFVSSIVDSLIRLGLQGSYLETLRKMYGERLEALSGAITEHLPQLEFSRPDGGYFIWARLPDGMDAEALLAAATRKKVTFQPGVRFSSRNGLRDYLRFSFSYYGPEDLVEGINRVAAAMRGAERGAQSA